MASTSFSSSSMKFQLGFVMLLFLVGNGIMAQTLTPTFYAKTCPNALSIIKTAVTAAVSSETRMGASLLRLHFHDCFVNGCDGSVLLDGTSSEKSATANSNSLRGFEVVDSIKSKLETACAGVVSCADVLAVAARDSVVALGGPSWKVLLGRRDSATASLTAANSDLPSPFSDLTVLLSDFSKKGFNAKETVALSGAHTIGNARCIVFRNRTYNAANIDASFATSLKTNCPATGGDTNVANLDVTTPTSFDNGYFKSLVAKKGLLHSDQELFNGGSTDAQVTAYSNNLKNFNADFGNAMVKMGNLGPLTGTSGQIRTNCRVAN